MGKTVGLIFKTKNGGAQQPKAPEQPKNAEGPGREKPKQ